MAKSKTKTTAKKKPAAAKKSAKPAPRSKARAAPPKPMAADARNKLLKPRTGADDLGEDIAGVWANERGLRVDDLTPAKLARLVAKSRKANAKEAALADAQARKMAPIRDARLVADDALWRGLLDLRASVGLRARKDPSIEERFAALIDALKGTPSDGGGDPSGGGTGTT